MSAVQAVDQSICQSLRRRGVLPASLSDYLLHLSHSKTDQSAAQSRRFVGHFLRDPSNGQFSTLRDRLNHESSRHPLPVVRPRIAFPSSIFYHYPTPAQARSRGTPRRTPLDLHEIHLRPISCSAVTGPSLACSVSVQTPAAGCCSACSKQGRSSPHPSCQLSTCQTTCPKLPPPCRATFDPPDHTPFDPIKPSLPSLPSFASPHSPHLPDQPTYLTQPYRQLNSWPTIPERTDRGVPLNQLLGPGRDKGHAGLTAHQEAGLSSRPIRLSNSNSRPSKHLRDGTETTGRTPHHLLLVTLYQSQSPNTTIRLVPAAGAARRMKH